MSDNVSGMSRWAYPPDSSRDLRIDFIRGIVMFILIVNHIDAFSLYALIIWERFGVVSGGEGFVILSGFVLGMVYRRRIAVAGWGDSIRRLVDRSAQLYRVNIFVIVSIALLDLLPFLDAASVMSYTNRGTGAVYRLYPRAGEPIQMWIAKVLTLKVGPHQFQIMGLYVVLLLFTPLILWLFLKGRTRMVLAVSWIVYFYNGAYPSRLTGAQFENAFPILTWQLVYLHGLAAGFHRDKIAGFWKKDWFRRAFWAISIPLLLVFMFYTQNNPNPRMPEYAKISVIPPDVFWRIYEAYFLKNRLGIGRLINYFVLLSLGYLLLTHFWKPINKAFGWFFISVGQASLYVFILHVYFLMLVNNFPIFYKNELWVTAACTLIMGSIWLMVRHKILFRWIPR